MGNKNRRTLPWQPKRRVSDKTAKKQKMLKVYELTKAGENQDDIATAIGVKDRTQVYRYQKMLCEEINPATNQPYLQRDSITNRPVVPKAKIQSKKWEEMLNEPFLKLPEIKKLHDDMKGKNKGQGLVNMPEILSTVLVVLNTVGTSPSELLTGMYGYEEELQLNPNAQPDHLNSLTRCMLKFQQCMNDGTVKYNRQKFADHRKSISLETPSVLGYVKAMRLLYIANGKPVPRGYGGKGHILSGAKENFGAYNDVQLSDEQKAFGIRFMRANFGEEYARFFGLMFEMMARTSALCNWQPAFTFKTISIDGNLYEYAETKIYESKTDKSWKKQIFDPDVIKMLKEMQQGQKLINETEIVWRSKFADAMLQFYVAINMLPKEAVLSQSNPNFPKFPKGSIQYYLLHHAIYVLRHSGAHMWMRRSNYNATLVAIMGWDTTDVLIKAYAEIPTEYGLQAGICFYCNPPDHIDTPNMYFCSQRHALVFLNNGRKSKAQSQKEVSNVLDKIADIEATAVQPPLAISPPVNEQSESMPTSQIPDSAVEQPIEPVIVASLPEVTFGHLQDIEVVNS